MQYQLIHTFLRLGLEQLQAPGAHLWQERVQLKGGRLEVRCSEAQDYLRECQQEKVVLDVVYLDPMFPGGKRKSALPKRRMQFLRQYLDSQPLLGGRALNDAAVLSFEAPHTMRLSDIGGGNKEQTQVESEVEKLIELARTVARKVVLKRADDGPVVLKEHISSHVSSSKIVRYDVYMGTSQ